MKKLTVAAIAAFSFLAGAIPVFAFEYHPEMHAALNSLLSARSELISSRHDFNGYRVRALSETDAAIRDVRIALASDRH